MIRRFDVLVALYIFGVMAAQLMGAKTFAVDIFGWQVNPTVAIFVLPLLFTLTDVVNEVFGRPKARRLVRLGIMVVGLQLLAAVLFTALPASERFASSEAGYDALFGTSIRFALASLAAFTIAELLDVLIFGKLRERLGKQGLWLRNNVSNFVSQLADSVVFMTLAFYTFNLSLAENLDFLIAVTVPYWLMRCGLSVLETPLVYIGVRWLKRDKRQEGAAVASEANA